MDFKKFTIKAQEAIQRAQQIAIERDHQAIECGHLMKGVTEVDENVLPYLYKKLSVNGTQMEAALDRIIEGYPNVTGGEKYLSAAANEALIKSEAAAKKAGDEFVTLEHLVIGLFKTNDPVGRMLKDAGSMRVT
jgi:ATP-dependent Clp protease ATP-binding subunit ClpB